MPKRVAELSAIEVKRLTHPGGPNNWTCAVGGVAGLLLQFTPSGASSWLFRYSIKGRRRTMGLGSYPSITLAMARARAREVLEMIWRDEDPLQEKEARRAALTFSEAMEDFLKIKLAEFDNEKHRKQWRATLDSYAIPVLGDMPVSEIGVQDVVRTLAPLWEGKTETASRLRGRIEMVLSWATVNGHRAGDNPARWRGNLDAVLPKPAKVSKVQHQPALMVREAREWLSDVRSRDGSATRALEFLAMTAARSGEVRGAMWAEIDRDAMMWVVPAERVKTRREHRVPLTAEMIALLDALPPRPETPLIFPALKGGQLTDAALSACMKRIHEARAGGGYLDSVSGRPATPHGLRSTFRDWCAERGVDRDLAEISLAHAVGSEVERAYRRTDMIERRRALMASWGAFLTGREEGEKVVRLRN